MPIPISDKEQIKHLLEIFDEEAIKQAIREMFPNWDL